jgi:hypothetical protein
VKIKNKNDYLRAMFKKIVLLFEDNGFNISEIKKEIQINCVDTGKEADGYCFWPESIIAYGIHPSEDYKIEVNKRIDDGIYATAVLIHEVCHVMQFHLYGYVPAHGKEFKKIALAVGLEGRMTQTTPSRELVSQIKEWERDIGQYPHSLKTSKSFEISNYVYKLGDCIEYMIDFILYILFLSICVVFGTFIGEGLGYIYDQILYIYFKE